MDFSSHKEIFCHIYCTLIRNLLKEMTYLKKSVVFFTAHNSSKVVNVLKSYIQTIGKRENWFN